MNRAPLVLVIALAAAAPQARAQCYQLPFANPNLADGWGSTCCGRSNPHRGVDFAQAPGTSIPAIAAGVVRLKTSSGCLGNVVVIEHGGGIFSGYAHMASQSPLAEGTPVAKGQTIGQVGNTGSCTTGPHLHLTIAPTIGGYSFGETFDPYAFITARQNCDAAPVGFLDAATCEGISGWAQDPDATDAAIDVHVYIGGPAGDPAAYGFAVSADRHRDDLCSAIGSCAHGFLAAVPLALFDGVERPVFAYGIGADGGANAQLANTGTLRCENAPLPQFAPGSVRRHVPSLDVFDAWQLDPFAIAPLSDDVLDDVPLGPDLSASPLLVRVDDDSAVYVREGAVLRHVPDPAAMNAWGFDFASIVVVAPADVADAMVGAPWPRTPFLARGSGDDVWLLDAPPPLWAELLSDDIPTRMSAGAAADVTLRFYNRGSLPWDDVALAPTPRDQPGALCDESWSSCTRAASFARQVAPGEDASVHATLRAPLDEGSITVCFGLVSGTHWFSDAGQNGPRDDALCRTIEIGDAPAESDDAQGFDVATSCSTGAPTSGVGLLLALALLRRHSQRRARRC